MNGFRKIFPSFLSHYAKFFAKMAERKVVPFDEFYYQLKLTHLFQKHPVLHSSAQFGHFCDLFKVSNKCTAYWNFLQQYLAPSWSIIEGHCQIRLI
jgi:hypothetical protein